MVDRLRKPLQEPVDCLLQTSCLKEHLSALVLVHHSRNLSKVLVQELPSQDWLRPAASFVVAECWYP
jgi:hypothetical protein